MSKKITLDISCKNIPKAEPGWEKRLEEAAKNPEYWKTHGTESLARMILEDEKNMLKKPK